MTPSNATRTLNNPPPPKREASNLLTRGLLARLHGVDTGIKSARRTIPSLPILRPHATAVKPPLTEDGQPPSLLDRERSILGPRAVSEPEPLPPLPLIVQQDSDVEVKRKREEEVSRRVDEALEETLRTKEKHREDMLAGVSRHYSFKPPTCLVIYEDDLHRFRRKRKEAKREARLAEKLAAASEGKPSVDDRRRSPSRARFPKTTDFISREQTKVDMNNSILEWKLPTRSCRQSQPVFHRPTACSVSGGKLCRSFYPVTEALHREGTSVSKLKGRSLGPGDCLVAKVWPRNLQKYATPLEMATEDRRFFYRGPLAQQQLNAMMLQHERTIYERQLLEMQLLQQMQLQQENEQRQMEQQVLLREQALQEQPEEQEQREPLEQEHPREEKQQILQEERVITEQEQYEKHEEQVLQEENVLQEEHVPQEEHALQEKEEQEQRVIEAEESNQHEEEERLQLDINVPEEVEKEVEEEDDE
ncbi:hypothetical protein LSAT2_007777, partial [Lamellibrachia satsuma]